MSIILFIFCLVSFSYYIIPFNYENGCAIARFMTQNTFVHSDVCSLLILK